jgi:hypothetical protein
MFCFSVAYDANAKGDLMCGNEQVMGIKGGKLEKETTVRYTFSVKWQVRALPLALPI